MTIDVKNIAIIDEAIKSRKSVRKFLGQPVTKKAIEDILTLAARAPSGTNMQPWQVHVIGGNAKANLTSDLLDAFLNHNSEHKSEYAYYPDEFSEPYKSRRKKVGVDLYGLLNIEKGAVGKMQIQHGRNFEFFDAPVALVFTIERQLRIGSWLDYGMFLQNIMIAARARGLDTCPQAAFAQFHKIFRSHLDISQDQIVICGMSLGYADNSAVENQLVTQREKIANFTRYYDF